MLNTSHFFMLYQNKGNLFKVLLSCSCCYIYCSIPICLCLLVCFGVFSQIMGCFGFSFCFFLPHFYFLSKQVMKHFCSGKNTSGEGCVSLFSFDCLLRIFDIGFLLLCLVLTVVCSWLIILLHSFLAVLYPSCTYR